MHDFFVKGRHIANGIFIKRMIHVPNREKRIEQRTTRARQDAAPAATGGGAI